MASNEMVIFQLEEETDDYLTVRDPIVLMPSNDGNLSLVPWSPLSEEHTTVKVQRDKIIYYATPNEELIKNYKDIFSTIITPQNSGKIIT